MLKGKKYTQFSFHYLNKMDSVKKSVSETRKYVEHLKVDALPNILRSTYLVLSLAWTVMLIGSAGTCTWLIIDTFHEYSLYQVTTTTRLLNEDHPTFPTISLCSINPFTTDYAVQLLNKINAAYLFGNADQNYNYFEQMQHNLNSTRGYYMTDEEKANLTDPNSFLLKCSYQGSECYASNFTLMFHPYYLGCYRFNVDGLSKAYLSGKPNQLFIEAYVGLPDSVSTFNGSNAGTRGLYVFIQNATEFPLSDVPSPYEISPGIGANFILDRTLYTQKEKPYSDCTVIGEHDLLEKLEDPRLFNYFVDNNYIYSQTNCISICSQLLFADECNCQTLKIDFKLDGYQYCKDNQTICVSKFMAYGFQQGYFIDDCLKKCPLECEKRVFDLTVTSFKYPYSDAYPNFMHIFRQPPINQTDYSERLGTNMVAFSLYFAKLSYTHIEEEPKMSAEVLLGTIGGHLHLFMGMSLMSFVEIVELGVLFVLNYKQAKQEVKVKPRNLY